MVGDGGCGKTSLLSTFKDGEFPKDYMPTVFETSVATVEVKNKKIQLMLFDTAGQEDYDRLRPISYPETSVLLLCFALDSRDSFENVRDKWVPEIEHFCPGVPFLLVGTKSDLRQDRRRKSQLAREGTEIIASAEGEEMANKINADGYMECSAKTNTNVKEVMMAATMLTMKKRGKDDGNCKAV